MRNKLSTLNRSIPDHHRLQLRIHPIQPVHRCFGLEATPLRDRSQKNGNSLKQWQTLRANREAVLALTLNLGISCLPPPPDLPRFIKCKGNLLH